MSNHNIYFGGEIRKKNIKTFSLKKVPYLKLCIISTNNTCIWFGTMKKSANTCYTCKLPLFV